MMRSQDDTSGCHGKLLAAITFASSATLLMSCLILAQTPPAQEYELSIYAAYPWYFWGLSMTTLILPIGVKTYCALLRARGSVGSFLNLVAWMPSALMLLTLLLIPLFRGYPVYGRGDTLTHLGLIRDILLAGGIADNGYPASHILVAILQMSSGVQMFPLTTALPAVLAILFILWMRNLGSLVFSTQETIILIVALAFLIKFERIEQFSPFNYSLFMLPLFLWTVWKIQNSNSAKLILVVLVVALVFTHIFFTVTLIVLMVALWAITRYWGMKRNRETISESESFCRENRLIKIDFARIVATMIAVCGFWAVLMYSYVIDDVLEWLLHPTGGTGIASTTLEVLAAADLTARETARLLWTRLGTDIFFYSLPLIFGAASLYPRHPKVRRPQICLNYFWFLYVFFIIVSFILLFPREYFAYDRVFRIVVLASIMISSVTVAQATRLMSRPLGRFTARLAVTAIALMLITTVLVLHRSPISFQENNQVTEMEIEGGRWFFSAVEGNSSDDLAFNTFDPHRFYMLLNGFSSRWSYRFYEEMIPDEFGYPENEMLSESLDLRSGASAYVIFTSHDVDNHLVFPERFWDIARTYSDDSIQVHKDDPSSNTLYDNGNVCIWQVYG